MGKKSVRSYLHGQVEGIYHKVGKGIGESRHELKQEGIQSEKIHSDSTRRAYLVRFHSVIEHARNNFGIKSVFQLTDDMVKSWLENERIGKVAASTINVDVAALGKIGQMMTNSSPPQRATVSNARTVRAATPAKATSTASPMSWP